MTHLLLRDLRLLHLISRRRLEQIRWRLVAADVGQPESLFAATRVGALGHHHRLQLLRVPTFADHLNRAIVADLTSCDGGSTASALGRYAGDHLLPERLGLA